MLIRSDEGKKIIYITPEGDLVADEAEALHNNIQDYKQRDMKAIVLDLARVSIIDPIALKSIITLCNEIYKDGGKLIVENASRNVKEIFRQIKIDGRLTISQTGWSR